MEGNYQFTWEAIAATGTCEGKYKQSIYGVSFSDAVKQFERLHGDLGPDEDGTCIVITSVNWAP